MSPQSQAARTLSLIMEALKVSSHASSSLTQIVKVIRGHFKVELCSLYELNQGQLKLVATDAVDFGAVGHVLPATHLKLLELATRKMETAFLEDRRSSCIAVPLIHREEISGLLVLQSARPQPLQPEEARFLEFIALQLAGTLPAIAALERAKRQVRVKPDQVVFKGIPASPGFGIGPALLLRAGGLSTPIAQGSYDVAHEWELLQKALEQASQDLLGLERRVEKESSKSESDIFGSHRMMLSDPDFLLRMENEVKSGKSPLQSASEVFSEFIRALRSNPSPGFEEKAVDLEELRERTLGNLLKIGVQGVREDWSGILVAKSLGPSDTSRLDPQKILGIVTTTGGPTSHAAILARSLGVPAVMGVPGIVESATPGDLLIVDGDKGRVILNPEPATLDEYEALEERRIESIVELDAVAFQPATTRDGRRIGLEANLGFAADLKTLRSLGAEGVGLFRTEFLFLKRTALPDEEEQFRLYRRMVEDADGLPITFRILDAGGDKPVAALHAIQEENPFLGYRSIRLLLSRPDILGAQLRALLRASHFGPLRLLIPMVSGMEEIREVQKMLGTIQQELSERGIPFDPRIELGVMIEIPSAVHLSPLLARHADFLSIGTNDLIQFTLAVDRNNEHVASYFEILHPGVLAGIARVAEAGAKAQKPVAVCGEAASNPDIIPLLVGLGITHLSMTPAFIPAAKRVIRALSHRKAEEMAKQALLATTILEVKAVLEEFHNSP